VVSSWYNGDVSGGQRTATSQAPETSKDEEKTMTTARSTAQAILQALEENAQIAELEILGTAS